jgi:hypothetical protein
MTWRNPLSLGILSNMEEAAARVDNTTIGCNPYPPDTEEHERWWARRTEFAFSPFPPSSRSISEGVDEAAFAY